VSYYLVISVGRGFSSCWAGMMAFALFAPVVPASACINGSLPPQPRQRNPATVSLLGPDEQAITMLVKAEEGVRLGNYWLAATELDQIRMEVGMNANERVKSRFGRISALVSIRTGGRWPFWVAGEPNNGAERQLILDEAVGILRRRLTEAPSDPIRTTDLGEALAGTASHRAEARRLLESLATKDLVTSAHGYAALSRLRAQAGDRRGAASALELCRRLDGKGLACGAAPASGAPS